MATAQLTFNTAQTAILMADFHREGMGDNPMVQERGTVQKARAVLDAARQAGVLVVYIVVNFRTAFERGRRKREPWQDEEPASQSKE